MQLTRYTDYGLRVLLYLALSEEGGTVGEIAAAYGISKNHLLKVSRHLGQLGYVDATRGKSGGLRLSSKAGSVSVGEVVQAMEPNMDLVECFDRETGTCPIAGVCALEVALHEARRAFLSVLEGIPLRDVVKNRGELSKVLLASS